jgi:hypothetical protein
MGVHIQETLMMAVMTTVQSGAISRLATTTTTGIEGARTSLRGAIAHRATVTVVVVAGQDDLLGIPEPLILGVMIKGRLLVKA